MSSIKGHTHTEIETYLKQKLTDLKWFDKDKGQLENINNHVMPFPAILMSYGRTTWKTESKGIQKGVGILRFKIAYESYEDSFSGSVNQDKALAFFEFNEKVHEALQGLSTTYVKGLERITDEDDENHKNIIVTVFEYACTIFDNSAQEDKTFVLAEPELNVSYKKELSRPEVSEDVSFDIPN